MTPTGFPQIRTERCLLRQFQPNDLSHVFRGLSDPEVIRYYGISFDSLEQTRQQMEWFTRLEKDGTGIWWAVCSSDNRTFYGAAGINNLDMNHRKAEIGCWLLPGFWRQGLMQEIVPAICRYGFKVAGLHRIEAWVDTENEPCRKALSRLSFRHEGTMRECEIKDGKPVSLAIYALLRAEWQSETDKKNR